MSGAGAGRRHRAGRDHGDLRVRRRKKEGHAVADRRHARRARQDPHVDASHRPQHRRARGQRLSLLRRPEDVPEPHPLHSRSGRRAEGDGTRQAQVARRPDGIQALRCRRQAHHGRHPAVRLRRLHGQCRPADRSRVQEFDRLVRPHESPAQRRRLIRRPPTMHRLTALLALLGFAVLAASGLAQAADPPKADQPKGLFLLTDYPSQTVRAGEVTTVRAKLVNSGLAPEPVALSLSGVPAGWKVDILGGGLPIAAAMPGINQDVSLQVRVDVPKDAPAGSQKIVLAAKGPSSQAELPLTLTVGSDAPAKLSLKSRLPSLRGTPRSSFEYTVSVTNDSGKDLTVAVSAQAPANFQTTFTEGYGSNEISTIPIEAGQSKDIKVKVTPPRDVKAGDFPVLIKVAAEGATAELRVTLQVSGQGRLALTTKDGRLSGEAEVGRSSTFTLVLSNDGTAPIEEVEMSGTVPTNWKVEFNPKTIASLAPNEKKEVQAVVTPADKAIAGDYVAAFRANGRGESASADFRITVTTSTLWGIVGVGIIAIALLVL